MTASSRNLISLWDYGWLDRNEVVIPRCDSASEVISAYIRSDSFGTSFVGPQLNLEPDLHGPFLRASITPDDFQLISADQFATEIRAIRQPEGFTSPADDTQWQAVERVTSELARENRWIFALRLTEKDSQRFHDWGFVLDVFREFLFANPASDQLSRCIVGYD